MEPGAVHVERLGKRYRIGGQQRGYRTLRDTMVDVVRRPVMRLMHPGATTGRVDVFWALKDISLDVRPGEVMGVIGRNGAGKTTLLKILSRVTEPSEGEVVGRGRLGSLLEVGTGFHPELTGRENIYLTGAILGMKRAEIRRKFDEIVAFSEIERFLDTPVKRFSSGMYVRLAFGVAAHLEPEILIVDEVLAVGDVAFQRKCLGKMERVAGEGRTIFFVSHNMQAVKGLCTRAIEIDAGHIVSAGPVGEVVDHYLSSQEWQDQPTMFGEQEQLGNDEDLRLVSMNVLSQRGEAGGLFRSSEPITVQMVLDVFKVRENLCVGFDLRTSDGGVVFTSYHTDGKIDEWPQLHVGRNTIQCDIPPNLLNEGRFAVAPHAQLRGVKWIITHERRLPFDVVRDHSESPYGWRQEAGCIAPVLRWRSADHPS